MPTMRIDVINSNGQSTGRSVELSDSIFGIEPNEHAMYLAVKQFNAAQRQGTHKTKEKWEVARTTKKFKRQKGTGGARAGSLKSPTVKGGGRAFGPRPRNYSFSLNKKVKQLAKRSALSLKAKTNSIRIVEDFSVDTPKTKVFASLLSAAGITKRALVIYPEGNTNIYLSARNLPNASLSVAKDINTFEVLNASELVIFESSLANII
jgi:large subunit ribosomal protein L4